LEKPTGPKRKTTLPYLHGQKEDGFRNAMAGEQLALGRPNQRRSELRETQVKRRTERGEQGKLDGVLTAGRDEEEQPDSAANCDGGLQLGSGHDGTLLAL
jgi:hypothetical protein